MQLQKILSSLTFTPIYVYVIEYSSLFLMIIFFLLALDAKAKRSIQTSIVYMILLSVALMIGSGAMLYKSSSSRAAINEAKITRSNDKIHIKSNSEFMKSTDLNIIAEKDGYIYVEFKDKTYRIEDLSKKGN